MDERILQLRVGVVVISAVVITGILVMIFGEWHPATYSVKMRFPSAAGVSKNTPIQKHGITIGRVSQVTMDKDGVLVEAKIDKKHDIYMSEAAEVGSVSMINDDAIIQIIPGKGEFNDVPVPNGAWIDETHVKLSMSDAFSEIIELREVVESRIDQAAVAVEQASRSISQTSDQIGLVAVSVNDALNNEEGELRQFLRRWKSVSEKAEVALDNFSDVMVNVNEIVGDEDVGKSIDKIPELLTKADELLSVTTETVASFKEISTTVDQNLRNLEGLTGPLGENGDQIVADVQTALNDVDAMINQVTQFLETVNKGEGSVGLLLNDPELYKSLLRTMQNVEEVTRRIQPIVNDVRTLTSKLATDPRQLGARGLLDNRPIGSGPKGTLLYKGPEE